jgi:hypothetical protein
MEKIETPVVAGVGGVAIIAALLSMFGGSKKETPSPLETRLVGQQSETSSVAPGVMPNQDGPWRAICQEYAPYPIEQISSATAPKDNKEIPDGTKSKIDLTAVSRGYAKIRKPSSSVEGATEVTIKNSTGVHKVTVHNYLIGQLSSCIPPNQAGKVRFVVATLPDPDKTEMRLEFDRYVTALEEAAVLRGYNFAGYWFPWRPSDKRPISKTEDELEAQLLREEQPGVLLFRNEDGVRLFVFVVGETSTSGINRMQMAQALAYRQQLLDKEFVSSADPLLIAGPHFSGALSSLWDVLKSTGLTRNPGTRIVIESPDAGSGDLIKDFKDKDKCNDGTRCSFRSVSISAAQEDQSAADYLKSIGYDKRFVAELVEDESGFGNYESGLGKPENHADSPFGLTLSYPRELSSVRTLSDKQSEQVATSGSKFLSLSTAPSTVKLSGGEVIERDRPLVYANDDEVSEVSNALADDVRVLRKNDIQCVVIGASNPLDRIYLLEYFHDKLPNVRLVVENADELEINHPQFIDLVGTVTVSSLPVIPQTVELINGDGTSSHPLHFAFASVAAEEEFLAVAMLLGNDLTKDSAQEDGLTVSIVGEDGFQFIPFQEYFEPKVANSRGSLVNERDHVELFHITSSDTKLRPSISIQFEQTDRIPIAFIVLSLLIYALTSFHFVRLWWAEHPIALLKKLRGRPQARPCTPQWTYGYRSGDSGLDFDRVYNLFVLNNQVFLLNLLLLCATPALSLVTAALKTGAWFCLSISGLLAIGYGYEYFCRALKVINLPVSSWPNMREAIKTKLLMRIYFAISIWYLLAGTIFLIEWRGAAQNDWRRTLSLEEGTSVVVPIAAVLLGWTLWGVVQTRRAKWVTFRKIDPISVGIGPISRMLYDEVANIHSEIGQTSLSWHRMAVLFGTVGLTSWWQWGGLRGLEQEPEVVRVSSCIRQIFFPNNFHWWFAIWGGIMLLATLILSAYQLYKIWRGLSRLLHRLENTSMKEAFEKLGLDDKVQIKIWDLGKAKMRFSEMFLTVKCLRYISGDVVASTAETALNEVEAEEFRDCQVSLEQAKALHNALNQASFAAIEVLEGMSTVPRDSHQEAELRRYLALRFVTFIRYVLLQMRNLTWFVVYGYFLACLSVKLYPFQGGKSLPDLLGVVFFIVLAMAGVMITGILRNPMLRLLEDRDSNPAGALQVILHLVTVGGVPLLALLAWQFPWIGQIAFSWLRPLWGAIH